METSVNVYYYVPFNTMGFELAVASQSIYPGNGVGQMVFPGDKPTR